MHTIGLVLACLTLASTSLGRTLKDERRQGDSHEFAKKVHSRSRSATADPLAALVRLLACDNPNAAFGPAGQGCSGRLASRSTSRPLPARLAKVRASEPVTDASDSTDLVETQDLEGKPIWVSPRKPITEDTPLSEIDFNTYKPPGNFTWPEPQPKGIATAQFIIPENEGGLWELENDGVDWRLYIYVGVPILILFGQILLQSSRDFMPPEALEAVTMDMMDPEQMKYVPEDSFGYEEVVAALEKAKNEGFTPP